MAEKIRVLLVEPMEKPRLVETEHTLENLQEMVGGVLQALYPYDDPIAIVCDDEGKRNVVWMRLDSGEPPRIIA